ncbi:MAG: outer membrane beta-barrel protein [Pseudomonadota bacterium]
MNDVIIAFKKLLLSTMFLVACSTNSYSADEIKSEGASKEDWSGFYLGGVLGYGFGEADHCDTTLGVFPCPSPGFPVVDLNGINGGATVGLNKQHGKIVLGIESDFSFADMGETVPSTGAFGCGAGCAVEIDWFATIRGRLGIANDNGGLLYVTGGIAFTDVTSILSPDSGSDTLDSAVVGGGYEMMLNDGWSAKLEGIHVFDGGKVFNGSCPDCFSDNHDFSVVRIGINKKLN